MPAWEVPCGAVSACGLYWHPVAIWLPLALLVSGAARLTDRATRRRIAAGLVFFVVGAAVVAVPALPSLASYGSVFEPRLADQHRRDQRPRPVAVDGPVGHDHHRQARGVRR